MITLIITTYNRDRYLFRCLQFLARCNFKPQVMIMDSSSPEILKKNKYISQILGTHLTGKYVQLDEKIPPFEKLHCALRNVKTKYVVFCADDDLILPNGIELSMEFLEQNPDYHVAHGCYLGHSVKKDETGAKKTDWSVEYADASLDHENAVVRLCQHLKRFNATFYGVHRTHQMLESVTNTIGLLTNQLPFAQWQELLQSCITVIGGKTKRLEHLYYCRSRNAITPGWETFITRDDFSATYIKFRNHLSAILSQSTKLSYEISQETINVAFNNYIKTGIFQRKFPNELPYREIIAQGRDPNEKWSSSYIDATNQDFHRIPALLNEFPIELETSEALQSNP